MSAVKEMPYNEKFIGINNYMKIVDDFAPQLVKEELGEEGLAKLQRFGKRQVRDRLQQFHVEMGQRKQSYKRHQR